MPKDLNHPFEELDTGEQAQLLKQAVEKAARFIILALSNDAGSQSDQLHQREFLSGEPDEVLRKLAKMMKSHHIKSSVHIEEELASMLENGQFIPLDIDLGKAKELFPNLKI